MMTKAEAVKWLESLKQEIGKTENRSLWHYAEAIDMVIEAMSEPKTGEWIDEDGNNVPLNEDGYSLRSCYCNQCHEWLVGSDEYETKGNFCPNCGARMNKGGDSE